MKEDSNEKLKVVLTALTLLVSIAAFEGRGPVMDLILGGNVIPLPPPGYGIIHDIPDYGINPDSIILPLGWYNSWRQKNEIVRQPYLILNKSNSNKTYKFHLAGEYPDISGKSLQENWAFERTFVILPNERSEHILVFQIDPQSNDSVFRFRSGDTYSVSIGFQRWNGRAFKQEVEAPLFKMTIPEKVSDEREWNVNRYHWIYLDLKNV